MLANTFKKVTTVKEQLLANDKRLKMTIVKDLMGVHLREFDYFCGMQHLRIITEIMTDNIILDIWTTRVLTNFCKLHTILKIFI